MPTLNHQLVLERSRLEFVIACHGLQVPQLKENVLAFPAGYQIAGMQFAKPKPSDRKVVNPFNFARFHSKFELVRLSQLKRVDKHTALIETCDRNNKHVLSLGLRFGHRSGDNVFVELD